MELYLMRHAIAVERGAPSVEDDAARPLTDEGRKKLAGVCRGLSYLAADWDVILTSPFVRARQTAEAVAAYFEMAHLVQEVPMLTPGHTTKQLAAILKDLPPVKSVLLVGHEPSLSQHLSCFLFGTPKGKFSFKKAGVACLEFLDRPEEGEGILQWMMGPGQLQRIGKKK
ncbi:MAG TPA: phosphohistidine phosphatase SixA [bacterium]|nr:phosphohistidine phosphatase SixA [bacterium]